MHGKTMATGMLDEWESWKVLKREVMVHVHSG
jgi:hypothetical protein